MTKEEKKLPKCQKTVSGNHIFTMTQFASPDGTTRPTPDPIKICVACGLVDDREGGEDND